MTTTVSMSDLLAAEKRADPLGVLSERNRYAVAMRSLGCTYRQVGETLGITSESARRLVKRAHNQLSVATDPTARRVQPVSSQSPYLRDPVIVTPLSRGRLRVHALRLWRPEVTDDHHRRQHQFWVAQLIDTVCGLVTDGQDPQLVEARDLYPDDIVYCEACWISPSSRPPTDEEDTP